MFGWFYDSDRQMMKEILTGMRNTRSDVSVILNQGRIIMGTLADLQAQVTASVTVEQSAVLLIQGIAAQLAALIAAGPIDPVAVQAMVDQLNASAAPLAAAILANTPAK